MNRIITLLFVILLTSCSKSIDIQLQPNVHIFSSSDAQQKTQLTQQDEVYVTLKQWLKNNSSGWYATSGRYPGGVYITSGDLGIQVTESKVIIYSTTGNKPKATYIQEIKKGSLNKIVNFNK